MSRRHPCCAAEIPRPTSLIPDSTQLHASALHCSLLTTTTTTTAEPIATNMQLTVAHESSAALTADRAIRSLLTTRYPLLSRHSSAAFALADQMVEELARTVPVQLGPLQFRQPPRLDTKPHRPITSLATRPTRVSMPSCSSATASWSALTCFSTTASPRSVDRWTRA